MLFVVQSGLFVLSDSVCRWKSSQQPIKAPLLRHAIGEEDSSTSLRLLLVLLLFSLFLCVLKVISVVFFVASYVHSLSVELSCFLLILLSPHLY